jgi:hypothetical protein
MKYNLLFTLLLALMLSFSTKAQVLVTSYTVNALSCSPSKMLDITLTNSTTNSMEVSVEASVKTSDGKQLCLATATNLSLNVGVNKLNGASVLSDFFYSELPAAQMLAAQGRLISGTYDYCVKVTFPGGEFPVESCFPLVSNFSSFLQLLNPMDKEVIEILNPTLTWTHSGFLPSTDPAETFEMILAEKKSDQSAGQALAENEWLLNQNQLKSHSILYPLNAPKLEVGKQYAWQVLHKYNGVLLESSDIWWFEIDEWEDPRDIKYVDINASKSIDVVEVYQSFYFRFDEVYNSDQMFIQLVDEGQKVIEPLVENDRPGAASIKKNGFNGYRFNLTPYHLKAGNYTLKIANAKGKVYSIKIHYNK